MTFDEILEIKPYSMGQEEKEKLLTERLMELTSHHRANCPEYKRILDAVSFDMDKVKSYTDLPFLPVISLKKEGIEFDLSNGILIHGGGWKKLISEAVSHDEFHDRLQDACGLKSIHDYYRMVEQTGCIYMECECGHLHASIFSDVIIRRPLDFSEADIGESGIIQVVSTIPESYPGHSLLTEDEGVVLGIDDCPCGRKGKYFKINGRLKDAEIRGCSDTYATMFR